MKRTDAIELDCEFEVPFGEITKSWVDEKTGQRFIVGAASGLAEDHDGERMSKRALDGMVNAINEGGIKVVAGSHEQNFITEIGEARKAWMDPETEQLMVQTELPAEGIDPLADKSWTETHKRKMGWSVGGRLQAAYHELTEKGRKRKVLDSVGLRHLCLTDKPAYQHSFAHAVAKTWDGDAPADDEFKDETLAKDTTTGSWVGGGGPNSGEDSGTGGKRNAGTRKPGQKGMSIDDDGKDDDEPQDDDNEEDVEPAERHLSCPQCGHEFAADIPVDMTPEERQAQDKRKTELEDSTPGDGAGEGSKNSDDEPGQAGEQDGQPGDNDHQEDEDDDEDGKKKPPKSASKSKEAEMDLEKRMKDLEDRLAERDQADQRSAAETVAKDKRLGDDVLKLAADEGVDPAVVKVVAFATGDLDEKLEKTRRDLSEGFELLGKGLMEVREALGSLPAGRKSVARVLKRGLEDDVTGKTAVEQLPEDASVVDVLKAMNAETYGIVD